MRRYTPLKPSRGTEIPPLVRIAVLDRDQGCVGKRLDWPGDCLGGLELDHVRASGGLGLKSRSTADNLVALCAVHHRLKTEYGRVFRPRLLDYLIAFDAEHDGCVDPCSPICRAGRVPA